MVYLCLNFDCDHPVDPISPLKEPLGQIVVCSTCGAPLSLFRDDTLSYEPLGQAQESVTFSESSYGNVTSVSTTSLYPSPAAAIGPPSDQNQDGYPLSASTYDSPIQHQLPIVKDMRRPWNFLEHGPTSVCHCHVHEVICPLTLSMFRQLWDAPKLHSFGRQGSESHRQLPLPNSHHLQARWNSLGC